MINNINALAKDVHQANKEKGFWDSSRTIESCLMLIISEAAEALEAHRKNRFAKLSAYRSAVVRGDDATKSFLHCIKDTFEDELADIVIRILDTCGGFGEEIGEVQIIDTPTAVPDALFIFTRSLINEGIEAALAVIYSICSDRHIDLIAHIRIKLEYNLTRRYKHGKQY